MKILVVSNMYPGRNKKFKYAGIFVQEQVEALNKMDDVDCSLFIIDGFKSKLHYLFGSFKLLFHILFNNYDVIHAHYGLSAIFTLLIPFKRWSNVILTLHGGDILSKQGKSIQVKITKRILKKVGKVLTLNDEMNSVVRLYTNAYEILPCGVDADFFNPEPKSIKNSEKTVVFPGKIDREVKNFPLFKEVVSIYNSKYSALNTVVLDGYNRDEVRDIMRNSHVMLMTSFSEGSPQAIKEAMSCDLGIFSSNVGDVGVLVKDVKGAEVFELGLSANIIADRLHSVLTESELNIGHRRDRIIALGLDNKQVSKKLKNIYEKAKYNEG